MQENNNASEVRPGDELDLSLLGQYCKEKIPNLMGQIKVKQFLGGASNLTYLISYDNREIVLRTPPRGTISKNAHDMGREYKVMKALGSVFPYVPTMLDLCEEESILGRPFYIMTKIEGLIFRRDLEPETKIPAKDIRKINQNFLDVLIKLHAVDYKKHGLADLGKGEGYVDRQIHGWQKRYLAVQTSDSPEINEVYNWLIENMPNQSGVSLIHNDYRLDNLVLDPSDPTKIIGVLDWEMCTLGDPLMDFGNSLSYWVEAGDSRQLELTRRQPSNVAGMMTRREMAEYYTLNSGRDI